MATQGETSDRLLIREMAGRWALVGAVALILAGGLLTGTVQASILTVGSTIGVAAVIGHTFGTFLHKGDKKGWAGVAEVAVDSSISAVPVAFYGPGGMVLVPLIAILPYLRRWDRRLGGLTPAIAVVAYLAASAIYGVIYADPPRALFDIPAAVYAESVVLASAAVLLALSWRGSLTSLRRMRAAVGQVEAGSLDVRIPDLDDRELHSVAQSLNRVIAQTAENAARLQRERDSFAAGLHEISKSTSRLLDMARNAAAATTNIADGVSQQLSIAEAARAESAEAAQAASELGLAAKQMISDTDQLLHATEQGRERAAEASSALLKMKASAHDAAAAVDGLQSRYKRIASFAVAISKIARQTHVLALNAAIEAARADERGRGFAVVAEQVRTLAGEAGRSARDVTDLIGEVQEGFEGLAESVGGEEAKVSNVSAAAMEASVVLEGLSPRVSEAVALAAKTAEVSQSQAARMESLAAKMSQLASLRTDWTEGTRDIAVALQEQVDALLELDRVGQDLAQLAGKAEEQL